MKKKKTFIEPPQPYRSFRCKGYEKCLRTAALLDHPIKCKDCPNERFPEKKSADFYDEILLQDALCCMHLLVAIFHPERWLHQGVVKAPDAPTDAPLARVDWMGG